MIHQLTGKLIDCDDDYAVVDVNGLAFAVVVPGSTAQNLPKVGEQVKVFTVMTFNANDGEFSLFGFASETERDCFNVLKSINRVGPRSALNILSQIEISLFAKAIIEQDLTYLSKIKGIGKKTAERLIVELREKMVPFAGSMTIENKGSSSSPGPAMKENVGDAMQGMMALGCKQNIAEKAIRAAVDQLGEDASTEELLREGLKWR